MTLSEEYRHQLRNYSWPGNVRELENAVHRKVFLCEGNVLRCDDPAGCFPSSEGLAAPARGLTGFREAKARAIAEFERSYLAELLRHTAGNVSHAARMCGQERSRLNKLVRKHGL
jgi:DNA-binding NtrC family response regulator